MFDLKGNVAVVTGGGGGLGRQFALALAKAGAKVALLARRQAKLDAVKAEIEALGGEALAISTDVTDVKTIIAARDKILEQWGRVDILVNNAGGGVTVPIEELSEEDWAANRALDFDGVFYCMKYFGQVMLKQGYGRIINIASILGKGGLKEMPIIAYTSAKGGVVNMTRHAAAEWATKGITVNAICPGFFASEANSEEAMELMADMIRTRTPMERPGKEGELDSTVVYLAAPESSYVTGVILPVDGGWTCI
ncbi:short-chain dehydrogenase [Christensenellaceae bacterium]|nr:short-chain dehydrogenase [Christensenellaceae bacterium]BDF60666.1 short-chain dehydrogenase [Christensenellaceae bacterium]